jgi:SAM-dependent methyltransferase
VSRDLDGADEVQQLIAAQRAYYDLRAPDYGDVTKPSDRKGRGLLASSEARRLIDEFAPSGDVLELACGSGGFTRELVRHAHVLTAVDGSPRMLERNRSVVCDRTVDYVCADLFEWKPTRRYDAVFFGFWLSHVPPTRFDAFWSLVRSCLRPGGRAGFVDEDTRAQVYEASHTDAGVPTARRTLSDGIAFDIVKVFWDPPELERRLHELGWRARVAPVGEAFLWGVAQTPE